MKDRELIRLTLFVDGGWTVHLVDWSDGKREVVTRVNHGKKLPAEFCQWMEKAAQAGREP